MISKDKQNELLERIYNIENKIQEIYFVGEFEKANALKAKIHDAKLILKDEEYQEGFFIVESASMAEGIISGIETSIESFFNNRTNDVIEDINIDVSQKSTEDTLKDLKLYIDKWETEVHSDIENKEFKRKVARVMLGLIKKQAEKGEEVDLGIVQNYCDIEDFMFVIRERLIKDAQKDGRDEAEKKDDLQIAKNLNAININYTSLWQKLTRVPSVRITGKIEKRPEESYALVVSEPKKGILEYIKNKIASFRKVKGTVGEDKDSNKPKSTIYYFGDVNPYTFEWENVSTIIGEFPPKFSKEQEQRLLGIEINDVPIVTRKRWVR